MVKILGASIDLAYALSLSEPEFRQHYKPIFGDRIEKAWIRFNEINEETRGRYQEVKEVERSASVKKSRGKDFYNKAE